MPHTLEPRKKINFSFFNKAAASKKPTVVLSACLLGDNVRYDGKNKQQPSLEENLATLVHIEKICPEVSAGLSVPRPPVKLIEKNNIIHAIGVHDTDLDITKALQQSSQQLLAQYNHAQTFILKSRSPSCGTNNTPIYNDDTETTSLGSGIFTQQLISASPNQLIIDNEFLFKQTNISLLIHCCYLLLDLHHCPDNCLNAFCLHHSLTGINFSREEIISHIRHLLN